MDNKPKILVVDDMKNNLNIMQEFLLPLGYEVILANSGKEALKKVKEHSFNVILLDIMMPEMDGYEVARLLKDDEETKIIPIVMITALKDVDDRVRALEAGADDFLNKPFEGTELKARVQSLLKVNAYHKHLRDYRKQLEIEVQKKTKELKEAFEKIKESSLETIHRLTFAAEYKDDGTGAHIQRIGFYSAAIARKLGLSDKEVGNILYAAPMHDIGKIGVPDRILLKPGKLNAAEWEIMKEHTVIGANILGGSDAEFIRVGEVIALSHHEKWEGSGYPKGLKGEDIPLVGRIVAVADVFDALVSKRPYKEAFPLEKAFDIIKEGKGNHFDPQVVDAFFAAEEEILIVREKFKHEGLSRRLDDYSQLDDRK